MAINIKLNEIYIIDLTIKNIINEILENYKIFENKYTDVCGI